MNSAWVLFELGARWGTGNYLVALLAGDAHCKLLPDPIASRHAVKCDDEEKLVKLIEEIGERLQIKPRYSSSLKQIKALIAASEAVRQIAVK